MIPIKQIVEQVREVAATRPNFVYTAQDIQDDTSNEYAGCGYAGRERGSTKGVGCIVGQALQRLGLSKETLVAVEMDSPRASIGSLIVEGRLPGVEPAGPDRHEVRWLSTVQSAQDMSNTWDAAVKIANDETGEVN